jgi:hypothetical protein
VDDLPSPTISDLISQQTNNIDIIIPESNNDENSSLLIDE